MHYNNYYCKILEKERNFEDARFTDYLTNSGATDLKVGDRIFASEAIS